MPEIERQRNRKNKQERERQREGKKKRERGKMRESAEGEVKSYCDCVMFCVHVWGKYVSTVNEKRKQCTQKY